MNIKTYICPDIHCENCVAKVKSALEGARVQGVDVVQEQCAVRVGLLDDSDNTEIIRRLTEAGFPPQEQLVNDYRGG